MMSRCLWCDKPFRVRKIGAHHKKFCSPACKDRYHSALRRWAQEAITLGHLTVAELKAALASCTTEPEAKGR